MAAFCLDDGQGCGVFGCFIVLLAEDLVLG